MKISFIDGTARCGDQFQLTIHDLLSAYYYEMNLRGNELSPEHDYYWKYIFHIP